MASGDKEPSGFITRYDLWSAAQREEAKRVARMVEDHDLNVVRLSFADQHGILRGKTLLANAYPGAMESGVTMTTTLLAKDTSHHTVYPVFTSGGGFDMEEMTGGGDFVMVPDPFTFKILPWSRATGWMLCDLYFPNGDPVPFSTRQICRTSVQNLADTGYSLKTGLEVEFHILKLEDPKLSPDHSTFPPSPPDVSLSTHGYQYLTEIRMDQLEPILDILRENILALDLPLRSLEVEFGPSQCEMTFHPDAALETADTMILFRSAVKQVCRRHGFHATFMCRPGLPNLFSSGWHLHQSLVDAKTGANLFVPGDGATHLSPLGMQYMAGLLANAQAASIFSTPTINGYKRYRPNSLAPDRAVWAKDNRGVMVRVIGGMNDPATRLENRIGEPAANPYLYIASQIVSGMDGIARQLDPGAPSDTPYETSAPPLPRSLLDAILTLKNSSLFQEKFGNRFVDYLVTLKEFEVTRFLTSVTDWEQQEYFEIF
ncbi:MAG: glutamine synthetase family protein [Fimbriimonadaceae bacterium]|nr:glutamine synthetase family protein [Alphaproteobacteria bacterium]